MAGRWKRKRTMRMMLARRKNLKSKRTARLLRKKRPMTIAIQRKKAAADDAQRGTSGKVQQVGRHRQVVRQVDRQVVRQVAIAIEEKNAAADAERVDAEIRSGNGRAARLLRKKSLWMRKKKPMRMRKTGRWKRKRTMRMMLARRKNLKSKRTARLLRKKRPMTI